jgi:CobQ-like glutamine amidotransferase family enzyme
VADAWAEQFDEVTFDIVNPELLPLLHERGVKILPPKKAAKEKALAAYEQWKEENDTPRFSITAEEDKAYADAVARGDMETAQDMLRDAAERAGYAPLGDYKDMHQAPSATVEKEDFTNIEALQEQLDNGNVDSNLFAIAQGVTAAPQDYFSPQGARWYGYGNLSGMESYSALNNAIRSINAQLREYGEVRDMPKVKVYRAVPKNIKGAQLESEGQWVSPSREYAVGHGRHRFGFNQYRIIEQEVPADQLWWDANDIREWGFDDGTVNAYQNTKNNRKLYEVTYDDNGELIPLSKRFDKRKADVRFSVTAQEDAAYMDAVNRGDMETAQRMVNETAKKAMPNTKVVDENGNPLVVYHGTPIRVSKWNTFNETRGGFNTDARDAKAGVFFTPDERFARYFMTHREVNPYSGEVTYRSWMPHMFSTYLNVQNLLDLRRMTIEDAEAFLSLLPDWYQRDYDAYEIVRMSRTKNGSK